MWKKKSAHDIKMLKRIKINNSLIALKIVKKNLNLTEIKTNEVLVVLYFELKKFFFSLITNIFLKYSFIIVAYIVIPYHFALKITAGSEWQSAKAFRLILVQGSLQSFARRSCLTSMSHRIALSQCTCLSQWNTVIWLKKKNKIIIINKIINFEKWKSIFSAFLK